MLTKFYLTVNGTHLELGEDQVKNWDDVKCSWKRNDFSGMVRTFTNKFEFVNRAHDLLRAEFQTNETEASASIALYAIGDDWQYREVFACPLDFSTYQESGKCIKLSAIDNSIAARIKANKNTKYEYEIGIGKDIETDGNIAFARIPMKESATYAITSGTNQDDGSLVVDYTANMFDSTFIGLVCDEIYVNGAVEYKDDVSLNEPYVVKAIKAVDLSITCDIVYDITYDGYFELSVAANIQGSIHTTPVISRESKYTYVGEYSSVDEMCLRAAQQIWRPNYSWIYYASVNNIVYMLHPGETWDHYAFLDESRCECLNKTYQEAFIRHNSLRLPFHLNAGDYIGFVQTSREGSVQQFLHAHVLSSSFVFSWTAVGDPVSLPVFSAQTVLSHIADSVLGGMAHTTVISDHDPRLADTRIMAAESVRAIQGAKLYTSFNEFCDWMETVFGYTYYLDDNCIRFVHRSELFRADAPVKVIDEVQDVSYDVNSGIIYSSVVAGYDKKDYNSINGRDELNFDIEYTTGSTVSEKKLQLKSKYRADGYGIEFAVQKRGKDTTDGQEDKDVFFVYDMPNPPIPAYLIEFPYNHLPNGAFSPLACIKANEGYIGAQAETLRLAFASSTGNSEVSIGGESLKSNMTLHNRLFTAGRLSFTTNDMLLPDDINGLVQVVDNGVRYTGYISEVEMKIGKPQATRYKLIVKTRELL